MALDSRVCDLIDHETHARKSNLIDQSFLPYEAKRKKGIPLSMYDIQDKQIWRPSSHGEYTTRSGY